MARRHGRPLLWLLVLLLAGCAGLPAREPLSGPARMAVSASFQEMAGRQRQCPGSVDADITLTLDSRFKAGTMSGYLQAKAPAFLKIVGVNPFGQPLVVLVSDGQNFKLASLREARGYEGSVASDFFRRYAPAGFDPGRGFYVLTGKLAPGAVRILAISNDPEGGGAWLELDDGQGGNHRLVLFDPERRLLRRYLQLDEEGAVTMTIGYADHYLGPCSLPGLITIKSSDHAGELLIRLTNWQTDTPFSAADFALELPPGFERVNVN
jgi:hypothetical protein